MPYKIAVRPLATVEIIEAYDWYELQREGLGAEFLEELEFFYNSLERNPHSYTYYEQPIRQGKIKRFPYIIVYEIFDTTVVVYSVFMTDRDPSQKRTG